MPDDGYVDIQIFRCGNCRKTVMEDTVVEETCPKCNASPVLLVKMGVERRVVASPVIERKVF